MKRSDFYLRLLDLAQGARTRKYFNFFLETLRWTREEIRRYQTRKLKELLDYAYRHTAYYREMFEKYNLTPSAIEKLEDLQKLPTLDRNDIRENFSRLISDKSGAMKYTRSSSSGTTGIPIDYLLDMDGDSAGKAAGYLFNYLSGWDFGRPSLHIWGNATSIQRWNTPASRLKRFFFRQTNLASTELNHIENYPKVTALINRVRPFSIDGYASSIYSLARYIETHGVKIHRPRMVFTTAENLFENEKRIIEKNLGPVSDIYGCGEINGLAVRPINEDRYYIFEPHVILEAEPLGNSDFKEVVVTNLDNKIMPFIRYKVGDLIDGVHEGIEAGACPQPITSAASVTFSKILREKTRLSPISSIDRSRLQFSYFKKINGRTADIIRLKNGKMLSPINIFGGTLFRKIGGVVKHKVTWNGEYLIFLFQVEPGFDKEKARREIAAELESYRVDFRIQVVDKLEPGASGKYRYIEINT